MIMFEHRLCEPETGSNQLIFRLHFGQIAPGINPPLVGSRNGAILLRFRLSVAPRFLWECLNTRTVS